jgi:hypothetical protein
MRNLAMALFATLSIVGSGTESKWTVTKGSTTLGTVTLLTSDSGNRAEWKASGQPAATVFLAGDGSLWLRTTGGDVQFSTISAGGVENVVVPALLLPFLTSMRDVVDMKDDRAASYSYRGSKATYAYDGKGASKIEVKSGGQTYTLTRFLLSSSNADASNFAIHPKTGAASRLARLSGNLLGPSDTSVSATAGGRGVGTKGLKLNDGGDYDAVAKLESRDAVWHERLDRALASFQKDGKVGKSGRND